RRPSALETSHTVRGASFAARCDLSLTARGTERARLSVPPNLFYWWYQLSSVSVPRTRIQLGRRNQAARSDNHDACADDHPDRDYCENCVSKNVHHRPPRFHFFTES